MKITIPMATAMAVMMTREPAVKWHKQAVWVRGVISKMTIIKQIIKTFFDVTMMSVFLASNSTDQNNLDRVLLTAY